MARSSAPVTQADMLSSGTTRVASALVGIMPNNFAYLVLYSWPFVVVLLFGLLPRTPALIWSVIGGYLILPIDVGLDPPILPAFNKELLPTLVAALMCLLVSPDGPGGTADGQRTQANSRDSALGSHLRRKSQPLDLTSRFSSQPGSTAMTQEHAYTRPAAAAETRSVPRRFLGHALLLLLITTPILTALENPEPVDAGPRVIAGLQLYDILSMTLNALVTVLPLLVARRYLFTPAHHVALLRILCIAGLIYSLPALFEVRMSPQLNSWFYGYFPHSFLQQIRGGSFRPVVFLGHGLTVATFFAVSTVAALALWRHRRASQQAKWALPAGLWLLMVLVLCKSLGALVVTIFMLPVVLLVTVRMQMLVAAGVAALVLLYPMLRGADVLPVEQVVIIASTISEDRAESLQFRLSNEDILLNRARLKPLSGWGSWGRNRVYDVQSGADISVTDGAWIIILGVYGWSGYIAHFGLLSVPILFLGRRKNSASILPATSGLCLALAINLIDLIPNSSLSVMTWLMAGALLGFWERMAAGGESTDPSYRHQSHVVKRHLRS